MLMTETKIPDEAYFHKRIVESDWTQNYFGPLSPLYQTAGGMTQRRSGSVNTKYTLSDLPPCLCVSEAQPLPEITEKVDQDKGRQ